MRDTFKPRARIEMKARKKISNKESWRREEKNKAEMRRG